MNKKQYLYVAILAKELNFSRAADSLGISQPTLSQFIKKTEKNLGVELFVRNGSCVTLTEAGEKYLHYAKKAIDIEEMLEEELNAISKYKFGNLNIALSPSKCYTLMPGIIAKFREKYPGVRVHVHEKLAGELLEGIENEEYSIGVTPCPVEDSQFNYQVVFDEEILLAIPKNSEVYNKLKESSIRYKDRMFAAIDFSFLDGQPFVVMQDWQIMQKQLLDLCDKANVSIFPVVECTNNLTMITMVQAGLGMCLFPSTMVEFSKNMKNDNVEFFSIIQDIPTRKIVCLYKKNKKLNDPEKYMINLLTEKRN